MSMDYETLNDDDKLLLARDRLRGLESDHYRISLTHEASRDSRMAQLEDERDTVREEIARLEGKSKAVEEASELDSMTVEQLDTRAEELGVEFKSSWKKQDKINALKDHYGSTEA